MNELCNTLLKMMCCNAFKKFFESIDDKNVKEADVKY